MLIGRGIIWLVSGPGVVLAFVAIHALSGSQDEVAISILAVWSAIWLMMFGVYLGFPAAVFDSDMAVAQARQPGTRRGQVVEGRNHRLPGIRLHGPERSGAEQGGLEEILAQDFARGVKSGRPDLVDRLRQTVTAS